MLTSYMENVWSIFRIFILCGCSGCLQKHYRIVYLGRSFVPNGLMASFKVIGVDIPSDGFSCFFEISILRKICFLILEAAEPTFNHDIICPSAFSLRSSASFSRRLSSRLLSNAREALARNSFFQLRRRFGWISFSTARTLSSFSPLEQLEYEVGFKFSTEISSWFGHNKYLLSFVGYSISNSLRNVVFSVLIYETIIGGNGVSPPFASSALIFVELL